MELKDIRMSLKLVLLFLSQCCILCSGLEVKLVTLDNKEVCRSSKSRTGSNIYWASEKKAILVIGRSKDTADSTECSIVVGAASTGSSRLQLSFEAFHISDCGVVLSVNQSSNSDFQADNTAMARIGCNHGKIRVLHSEEKHFVRIHIKKSDLRRLGYNFRINITVTEYSHGDKLNHVGDKSTEALSDLLRPQIEYKAGSNITEHSTNQKHDKLETTGVELHVVVIVGLVTVFVVAVSLWLLIKYLIRRTQRWQEQCTERNMERAIRLYNNQETPLESNYMYTALPPPLLSSRTENQEQNQQHKKSGQPRAGDITFIHSDGQIETFVMRENHDERHSGDSEVALPIAPLRPVARPRSSAADPDGETVNGDGHTVEIDMDGECPPSYDEALHMPTPQEHQLPLYVNLDSKKDDNHTT